MRCSLFLRSINLDPIEWSEAVSFTGEGSPFTGQILDKAFSQARAVVVLITGDDLARLGTRFQSARDPGYEKDPTPQARPNVLFEAGMAFGRQPERTILVTLGETRPFSDIAGRNEVRISNSPEHRQALAGRLKTAGCDVRIEHKADWLKAGDFDAAIQTPD
jgi:predicted nucleotide-binding protein